MDWEELLTDTARQQLIVNHRTQLPLKGTTEERDFEPVAKLFNPMGAATWLLSECDEDGLAFGLADLGFGSPEIGYISLQEIWEVRLPGGLQIEQDFSFKPCMTLSRYADEARKIGRIDA